MKQIFIKILVLFFTGTLLSCQEEPGIPKDDPSVHRKIVFNIAIESSPQTRVATDVDFKSSFEDGDQIGVFEVDHKDDVDASTKPPLLSAGNYIHNAKLTYSSEGGGTWIADEPLYYSSDKLDFYVYYPYNESFTNPDEMLFSVKTDQTTALNFSHSDLISGNSINTGKGVPVYMTVSHKFSLVQLEVDPANIDPNEPLTAMLLNCKIESTFDMDSNANPVGEGVAKPINMFRVEQPADANFGTKFTFRAIVPSQTVVSGKQLFLLGQNGKFYNSVSLSSDLPLEMATVHRQITTIPIVL